MEEFNFESELFEEQEAKAAKPSNGQFTPLYFYPSDFKSCDELDPKFKADPKLFKQFADYLYFKGDLSQALVAYTQLLPMYTGNSFMTKCVLESKAWCLAKLGRTEEAETLARQLLQDSSTYEGIHGVEYFLKAINKSDS